jgi:hypothetical protein
MGGDKWSKDVLAFFNYSIFSMSNSTTINNNVAQGHLADMWEGPVFHVSAPPVLSLRPNKPLPSIDNTETSQITAAQIGPSLESISTAMQDLAIAPGPDTQD